MIHLLPDHVINKLKAGEIVERPASILKECIENALDAEATHIIVSLTDGGNTAIHVQDNGTGIAADDAGLVLARYATSKISSDSDLQSLYSYGFRGEALASIAEISNVIIQTKTQDAPIGTRIQKTQTGLQHSPESVSREHGTKCMVQDIFYNTPARAKFLKTPQTEYTYCQQLFFAYVMCRQDIHRELRHNDKKKYDIRPESSTQARIASIYKKNRADNVSEIYTETDHLQISGCVGNARIRFPNASMMQFFVNGRPVEDKLIKKAVMQAYKNQFAPREYPLTILFVTIDPKLVDVNVHPRKKEVKFLDTQHVFGKIYSAVQSSLSDKKISYDTQSHSQKQNNNSHTYVPSTKRFDMTHATRHIPRASEQTLGMFDAMTTSMGQNNNQTKNHIQSETPSETYRNIDNRLLTTSQGLQIVGQVRNMYILCQDIDHIYYVDQHALAERIAFEKLKKKLEHTNNYISKSLLTPLRIEVASSLMTQHKLNELAQYGFDCAMISDHSMVVYGIPTVFAEYVLDIESLVDKLALMEHLDMGDILDHIFATKACKSSIKAGQKLSSDEMKQLLEDGHTHIPGGFVCQHGRPFFVGIPKSTIDTLFDRH